MAEKKSQKLEKRNFFEVRVPITSAKVYLYGVSSDDLLGRIIKIDLTRTLRGKSLELKAKVVKDNQQSLFGEPISLILAGSYVRRMLRKGSDYVEDSFNAETRDFKVLIKTFMITRNKVSRAIRNELRKSSKEYLTGYLKNRSAKEIFTEITTNKIQKDISLRLKKIYPLAVCEVRWFEIVGEKKKSDEVSNLNS